MTSEEVNSLNSGETFVEDCEEKDKLKKLVAEFQKVYVETGPLDYASQVPFLEQLADHYSSKDEWNSLLRAHAMYNSCAVREDQRTHYWSEKVYETQLKYWSNNVRIPSYAEQLETTDLLKKRLTEIREKYRQRVNDSEKYFLKLNCEPGSLACNENEALYKHILKDIPDLSKELNKDIVDFTRLVADKAATICGDAPCRFSVVAMGSLARGETTPYSDLEFMILTESDTKTSLAIEYFERLSVTIYFLVGNLGETKLKYMAIPELMTWSEEKGKFIKHWFNDCSKNGFKIDGLGDWAGNIPTGGGSKECQNQYINTVEGLVNQYQTVLAKPDPKESLRGDLSAMLANTIHIYGAESLHTDFRSRIASCQPNSDRREATMKMLQNDVQKFNFEPGSTLTHIRDAKWDIYRYPSLLILDLKIMHGIDSCDPWEVINQLQIKGKITMGTVNCLRFALCCGVYARLAAYLYHDSQSEAISVLSSDPTDVRHRGVWYFPPPMLAHMFIHLTPLKQSVAESVLASDSNGVIDTVMTDESRTLSVAAVHFFCHDYTSAMSLLKSEYPDDSVTRAEASAQRMFAQCSTEVGEFEDAEKILLARVNSSSKEAFDLTLMGHLYWVRSLHGKALEHYKMALALELETHANRDYHSISSSYSNIGTVLHAMGDFSAASEHFTKALDIELGLPVDENQPDIGVIYNNLGSTYLAQNDHASALDYLKKGLNMRYEIFGNSDHTDIAMTNSNIGALLLAQGDYAGAYKCFKQALDMRLRLFGNVDRRDVATSYNNIACALEPQGDYVGAYRHFKEALDMRLRLFGDSDQVDIAALYNNMGHVLHALADFVGALECHQKALNMKFLIYGNVDHPDIALSYNNLGSVLSAKGDHRGAFSCYKKALDMSERLFGDGDHTSIANAYDSLASALYALGDYDSSLQHSRKAVAIRLRVFGSGNHAELATSYSNMGTILQAQGDYTGAYEQHLKALHMRLAVFGNTCHVDIAMSYNNIGAVLSAQKDYVGATQHCMKALNMELIIFGNNDHVLVASSYSNLGSIFQNQGDYQRASEYHLKALEMRLRIFGAKDHPDLAATYCSLGSLLEAVNDPQGALEAHKKSLDMRLRIFGDRDHEGIATSYYRIGSVHHGQGEYATAFEHYKKALDMRLRMILDPKDPYITGLYLKIGSALFGLWSSRCRSPL